MNSSSQIYAKITGPIVMGGFGSIGNGTLPMIERHLDYDKSRITVIDPKDEGRRAHCEKHNVKFIQKAVTKDNYRELLNPLLTEGGGQGFASISRSIPADRHSGNSATKSARLYRHRQRALARLLFRCVEGPGSALQLRAARSDAGRQEARRGLDDGRLLLRRQSRHGLVLRHRRCSMSPPI